MAASGRLMVTIEEGPAVVAPVVSILYRFLLKASSFEFCSSEADFFWNDLHWLFLLLCGEKNDEHPRKLITALVDGW